MIQSRQITLKVKKISMLKKLPDKIDISALALISRHLRKI